MKIGTRLENIFAHAVAMDNRGLRNTIHCAGPLVFIINFDQSMIMRFRLRKNERAFEAPVSFNANDYDSSLFEVEEGRIVFRTSGKGYERRKICRTADHDIGQIRKTYHRFFKEGEASPHSFFLSKDCCSLLEDGLSHVELSVEEGSLVLRQRNIYSGTVIEVTPKKAGILSTDSLPETFGPVGLKTDDFTALFAFCESVEFTPARDFLIARDHKKGDFDAILAFCKYDEIINLEGGDENGRQEPQIRRRK